MVISKPDDQQSADAPRAPQRIPTLNQFAQLLASERSPLWRAPPAGHLRGVDFYSASRFPYVLAYVATAFHAVHSRWPEIVHPQLMTDKIFWSMFFRPMKVPETGNKLLTSSFIPANAGALVNSPEIVWHSRVPRVPRAGEVEPGTYYLKTSHGADMYRRVAYPISDAEAEELDRQFGRHLSTKYGLNGGEWWYSTFQPQVLLERAIGSAEFPISWNLLVIDGEVVRVTAYQKIDFRRYRQSRLTPEFTPLTPPNAEGAADYVMPSKSAKEALLSGAHAIGKPLRFARIDFLLDDEERVYLGEVTFAPGGALARVPEDLDLQLGQMWDLRPEMWG